MKVIKEIKGNGPYTAESKQEIRRVLVGKRVFARNNNTAYKIENIDFSMNPVVSTFPMKKRGTNEEERISYWEYYTTIRNYQLQSRDQPLLKTFGRNKQRIYLLPEICLIAEVYVQKGNEKKKEIKIKGRRKSKRTRRKEQEKNLFVT